MSTIYFSLYFINTCVDRFLKLLTVILTNPSNFQLLEIVDPHSDTQFQAIENSKILIEQPSALRVFEK